MLSTRQVLRNAFECFAFTLALAARTFDFLLAEAAGAIRIDCPSVVSLDFRFWINLQQVQNWSINYDSPAISVFYEVLNHEFSPSKWFTNGTTLVDHMQGKLQNRNDKPSLYHLSEESPIQNC